MNDASPKKVWQERLDFLLVEEAKASDPVAKFSLAKAIDEAKRKLKELEPEEEPVFAADISRIIKYAPERRPSCCLASTVKGGRSRRPLSPTRLLLP